MDTDPLFAVFAPPNAERLRRRLGVGPSAPVELATTGWCKVVALFDSLAVLVPRHHELAPAMRREVRALDALRAVGLPGAPRLYEVIEEPDISPLPLAVVERVEGADLASVEPTLSRTQWNDALRGVGRAIALVHDHASGPPTLEERGPAEHRAVLHGLVDDDHSRRLEALEATARMLGMRSVRAGALADRLASAAAIAPVVVHNDLHEAQVMIGPSGVTGLIDWQTASTSHPFVDFDVLQWGRGALARLDPGPTAHRRAMWEGADGDRRYGAGSGGLLELAWTLNDGWWAASSSTAPVTGFTMAPQLRHHLMGRARSLLMGDLDPEALLRGPASRRGGC